MPNTPEPAFAAPWRAIGLFCDDQGRCEQTSWCQGSDYNDATTCQACRATGNPMHITMFYNHLMTFVTALGSRQHRKDTGKDF